MTKPLLARLAPALLLATLGCATTSGSKTPSVPARAGHGYALLHQLLGQEAKVSMLLIIKSERKELGKLIDAISETTGNAAKQLEELADAAPPVDLRDTGLPGDEVRARESIASTRRDRLLAAEGRELELELLLSQNEALTYGVALTDVLARNESNEARLAFVRALWKDLSRLQQEVLAMLRAG